MISSIWFLLSLLILLFFTLISKANAQVLLRNHKCNQNHGIITDGSAYKNNRNTVFEQIYSNKTINYGFYNFSYGNEPDKVYAIGLCRGDIEPDDCRSCLSQSATLLAERCSIRKEAIGYYDSCTLRYSNNSLYGVMDTEIGEAYHLGNMIGVDYAFNQTLSDLWDELKSTAADGDSQLKFAEKSVKIINESSSNSNETIYGLLQCTPDLSKENCTNCLDTALSQFSSWCKDRKGCLYLGPYCSGRYDITPFFKSILNNPESPAPQPQLPGKV